MKLYRATTSREDSAPNELWFTSDLSYLNRVTWRDVAEVIEVDIEESVIRQYARRHGKKSLPKAWQSLRAFHAGDEKIQVKFEHGSLNFGFYGSTLAIAKDAIKRSMT